MKTWYLLQDTVRNGMTTQLWAIKIQSAWIFGRESSQWLMAQHCYSRIIFIQLKFMCCACMKSSIEIDESIVSHFCTWPSDFKETLTAPINMTIKTNYSKFTFVCSFIFLLLWDMFIQTYLLINRNAQKASLLTWYLRTAFLGLRIKLQKNAPHPKTRILRISVGKCFKTIWVGGWPSNWGEPAGLLN